MSFYSPYANNTWLSWSFSYSLPNALIVGNTAPFPDPDGNNVIFSVDMMVIEFTQPSKDVAFLWGNTHGYYNSGQVQIINDNNQVVANFPVTVTAGSWTSISLNQFSQRIKKVALTRPPVSDTRFGHIRIDNFQFTPVTTSSPVGYLDGVNIQQATAFGWSRDPDDSGASNYVDCYVDGVPGQGTFIGRVLANGASPDLPPGNHRFSMSIPIAFRDGNNHQMRCYGIDITGGDPPALLTGSPKTFKFNAPIGNFDSVTTDGDAVGWSQDPDLPNQPNIVHFYINAPAGSPGSVPIGQAVANIFRPDVGAHGFRFSIPPQYRDNVSRTIYAYGLDLTGDNSKPLGGNPKTFQLSPVVQTTTFVDLISPLDANPNAGGGKRIFPDKPELNNQEDRNTVQVKVRISSPIAGIPVYFKPFDLDEPSTNSLPLDINDNNSGGDNRSAVGTGIFACLEGCEVIANNIYKTQTNASGETSLIFAVAPDTHPGDNFVVAASTKETDLLDANIINQDLDIRSSVTNQPFQIGVNRTEMLTVWRRLHIEIDSMGVVENNVFATNASQATVVGTTPTTIPLSRSLLSPFLEPGRFENGRMTIVNGTTLDTLYIDTNDNMTVTAHTLSGTVTISRRATLLLYDDDDFNSNNIPNGFNADNGENVTALNDSLNLLQENDDKNCSDLVCNVFAEAYIRPTYGWASQHTSDTPFVLNTNHFSADDLVTQIETGIFTHTDESSSFWVAYVQIAYQPLGSVDCDPIGELDPPGCAGGATAAAEGSIDSVRSSSMIPLGGLGSLVFIETVRDAHTGRNKGRITTVPHEIGHQFGIKGDNISVSNCGLMCYDQSGITFSAEHLNVIRWRRNSPGDQ